MGRLKADGIKEAGRSDFARRTFEPAGLEGGLVDEVLIAVQRVEKIAEGERISGWRRKK